MRSVIIQRQAKVNRLRLPKNGGYCLTLHEHDQSSWSWQRPRWIACEYYLAIGENCLLTFLQSRTPLSPSQLVIHLTLAGCDFIKTVVKLGRGWLPLKCLSQLKWVWRGVGEILPKRITSLTTVRCASSWKGELAREDALEKKRCSSFRSYRLTFTTTTMVHYALHGPWSGAWR